MTNNEIVVRALANTGITALNEMQQAVLDAGTTKDMVLLSPCLLYTSDAADE